MKNFGDILSLFCGCGGLDLGFEQAGFNTGLAYDRRPDAVSSWNRNRKKAAAVTQDIQNLTIEEIDAHFGDEFRPVGVIGGPPCQGFSLANRHGGSHDPRNRLVDKFLDISLEIDRRNSLSFIVIENVPAMMGSRGSDVFQRVISRLRDSEFEVISHILDAVDYGVPQRRKRLFVVAIKKGALRTKWNPPIGEKTTRTVRDALHDIPDPAFYTRECNPTKNPYHENHWCMKPKSEKFFDGTLVEGFTNKRSFKTLYWDRPSYTASYGNREVHVHPTGKRRLSVFEAMTLQGFPKKFVLNGTMSSQITQVSEAVPPPLAFSVANSVVQSIHPKPFET